MYHKCRDIIAASYTDACDSTQDYMRRHAKAWGAPNPNERGIQALISAFATLADSYAAQTEGERLLGQDGYFAEHAEDLIRAIRAYLNFDVGRFDCGTLDQLICDLAEAAGVELEP